MLIRMKLHWVELGRDVQEKLISWSIKHRRLAQFAAVGCLLIFLNQPFCMQFSRSRRRRIMWCVEREIRAKAMTRMRSTRDYLVSVSFKFCSWQDYMRLVKSKINDASHWVRWENICWLNRLLTSRTVDNIRKIICLTNLWKLKSDRSMNTRQ